MAWAALGKSSKKKKSGAGGNVSLLTADGVAFYRNQSKVKGQNGESRPTVAVRIQIGATVLKLAEIKAGDHITTEYDSELRLIRIAKVEKSRWKVKATGKEGDAGEIKVTIEADAEKLIFTHGENTVRSYLSNDVRAAKDEIIAKLEAKSAAPKTPADPGKLTTEAPAESAAA